MAGNDGGERTIDPDYAHGVSVEQVRRLDLNLITALSTLLEERNVTAAARLLGVTQPSASASLAKLRRHFNDELLLREGGRYHLTPLATDLLPLTKEALQAMSKVFALKSDFDPREIDRQFTLAASDYGTTVLGGALTADIAERAPRARIRFTNLPANLASSFGTALRDCDGILVPRAGPPPGEVTELFDDVWCCVLDRAHHPPDEPWTTEAVARHSWVAASIAGDSVPARGIARVAGFEPSIEVLAPSFASVPWLVKGTRRIGLMQRRLAVVTAPVAGLEVIDAPWPPHRLNMLLYINHQRSRDPATAWLRDRVAAAARALDAPG